MEGISGIDDWHQIFAGCREYEEFGRIQVTEDVNATIRGLRRAGATDVRVVDYHGSGGPSCNVIAEKLEKGAKLFQGPDLPQRLNDAADKSVTAAVFVGFHAMTDTRDGFLRHTINMDPRIRMNGRPVGETAINAYALAEYGISVVMVTGDQAVVREAKALIAGVETAQVKTSVDSRTTKCLPPLKARNLIESMAEKALSMTEKIEPVRIAKPVRTDVSFPNTEQVDLCETIPKANRTAKKTISYTADHWDETDKFVKTCLSLANEFHIQTLVSMLGKLDGSDKISFEWAENRINRWLSQEDSMRRVLGHQEKQYRESN